MAPYFNHIIILLLDYSKIYFDEAVWEKRKETNMFIERLRAYNHTALIVYPYLT
jgi:hypothetical protein